MRRQNVEVSKLKSKIAASPVFCIVPSVFCGIFFVGCSQQQPATQPSTMYERQEQALRDPYGYNPDLKTNPNRVSGNGDFDRDGIKRDWDHVINP
jgi:hypothetical protein